MSYGFDAKDQTEWISLLCVNPAFSFKAKEVQKLKIPFLNADAAGGSRGTRVYLKYDNLSIPAGERSHYLNIINRSGKEYIPLHVGFVGSNAILNDGTTSNELTLRITNISTKDTIKFAKSRTSASNASRFSIYFDLQQNKPWALATINEISGLNIKLDSVSSKLSNLKFQPVGKLVKLVKYIDQKDKIELESDLSRNIPEGSILNIIEYADESKQKIERSQFIKTSKIANQGQKIIQIEDGITFKANSEVQEVTFTPPSNMGSSASSKWEPDVSFQREFPIWTFTYIDEQETTLLPHEYIELKLSNLLSSMPSGYTNLYIRYEDIPDYWDGNYTCLIEKTPLLYRQNPDNRQFANNVGIGTDEPKAKLHVSVVRENEKVVPNKKQPAAIFVGGGVGIGVAPGSDDQLKVQGNAAIAGNLSITDTTSPNSNVGIGTDELKAKLYVRVARKNEEIGATEKQPAAIFEGGSVRFSKDYTDNDVDNNNIDRDLILYLRLDNLIQSSQGKTVPDLSNHSHSCSVHGNPSIISDERLGNCLSFTGDNDSITCQNINISNSSFTIQFWAKFATLDSNGFLIIQGSSQTKDESLHIGFRNSPNQGKFTFAFYSNDLDISPGRDLEWHHWACVYDLNHHKRTIYRDGESFLTDFSVSPYKGAGNFIIGSSSLIWASRFRGSLANFRIHKRALSSEEILLCMGETDVEPTVTIHGATRITQGIIPNYDSGWFSVTTNSNYQLIHKLGTYLLQTQILFKDPNSRVWDAKTTLRYTSEGKHCGCYLLMKDKNTFDFATNEFVFCGDNTATYGRAMADQCFTTGEYRILAWKVGE